MAKSFLNLAGQQYTIVTLDFETYYDKEYTLSGKLNTSEYVRDDRFHAHGVGIKIGDGKTHWYTGDNIALALREIDWSISAMLGHNVPFDGFICSHVYGIKPALYLDTLSMARAAHGHHTRHDLDTLARLHGLKGKVKRDALADTKGKRVLTPQESAKLGGYCVDDVEDTYTLFQNMLEFIPDDELMLIHMTVRMFCDPVLKLNLPRIQQELEKEIGAKYGALLRSGATAEELISNQKFAALLSTAGASLPIKISPRTGQRTYAFAKSDLEFKKLQTCGDPRIEALCEARVRLKSSIGETRAGRFLEAGKDGMPLPILLNYSGAHTHRWTGGNKMNLQNLPRGGELRRSIEAPKGYSIVVADSAQIEARVLAWLAGQQNVIEAFAQRQDLYSKFASSVYNRTITRADPNERHVGKVCVLGLGFGMGATKLQLTLAQGALGGPPIHLDDAVCKRIVQIYRSQNSRITAFWRRMDYVIAAMMSGSTGTIAGVLNYGKNYIQLPNGLFLQYYGLHGHVGVDRDGNATIEDAQYLTRHGKTKLYGGLLTENVVQAVARCIIAEQMLKIDARYRVVTMTHDEVVVIAPKRESQKCLDFMLETMSTPPEWASDLPLFAEGGFDDVYSK